MRALLVLVLSATLIAGCGHGRYQAPGFLAGGGALAAGTGAVLFTVGDRQSDRGLERVGFGVLTAGVATLLAAAIWIAARSSCQVDADCPEGEHCQRIFTTAGPYGHCIAR